MALFGTDQVIDEFPGRKIYVGKKEGNKLENVIVFEMGANSMPMKVTYARTGMLEADLPNTRRLSFPEIEQAVEFLNVRPDFAEMTSDVKRILFVCVENSNRSQMAEAFARIHGGEDVEAFSAGSQPSGIVNPNAIEAMRELGYDLSRQRSKSIVDLPDIEFDFVATMGCGDACPFVRAKRREDWDIPDPKALPPEEFHAVRDLIGSKVKTLLETLD